MNSRRDRRTRWRPSRRRRLGSAIACLAWGVPAAVAFADAAVLDLQVEIPRAFGYVIGDTLEQRIELELAGPHRLDPASLPQAGRQSRWLELRAPIVRSARRDGSTVYDVVLTYQIFGRAEAPSTVVVPSRSLATTGGDQPVTIDIPGWRFTVMPLRPPQAGASLADLRADSAPAPQQTRTHTRRLIAWSAVLLLALGWLGYVRWGLPLAARRARPFASAWRQIRRLERGPADRLHYQQALRCLHEAFNRTAGRALYADGLDDFFRAHDRYAVVRPRIERLFARSREMFFTAAEPADTPSDGLRELESLCRDCRALERGVR